MIDIHNHLLGEDSVTSDLTAALALCRRAREDGVEELVVTLRMAGDEGNERAKVQELENGLNSLRSLVPAGLRLSRGFEWALDAELGTRLNNCVGKPTIADSRYLLVSLDQWRLPPDCVRLLTDIERMGYTPVISHPECSRALRHAPEELAGMIGAGALVQVDASSLTGGYGEEIAIFTRHLLEVRRAHFIATRAASRTRCDVSLKDARDCAAKVVGRQAAKCMVWDNPRAVLANSTLTEPRPARHRAPILKAALTYRG